MPELRRRKLTNSKVILSENTKGEQYHVVLKRLSARRDSQLGNFLSEAQGHVYLMVSLKTAESPKISRTTNRSASNNAKISAPVGPAIGDPTGSSIGDVGASNHIDVSKSSADLGSAKGEQAFAAEYVQIKTENDVLGFLKKNERKSQPIIKSKGINYPGPTDLASAGCIHDEDERKGEFFAYV